MLIRIVNFIKELFTPSISDEDKTEFEISINRINIARAKITTITFVVLEVMMLLIHYRTNRETLFDTPYIYYGSMYVLMLTAMMAFFAIFTKLGADVPKNTTYIRYAGLVFICFILIWCAGITLLDQLSSGQVIVYVVAVILIAVTPIYEPSKLFLVYLIIHSTFLIIMPFFQKTTRLLFGNSVNTTTIVIMSWVISHMRYKKQAEDFNNKRSS